MLGPNEWLKPGRDGSYTFDQITHLLTDAWQEPRWRERAEIEDEFYDGNQLTSDTLRLMKENGIPPYSFNKIASIVDSVQGFEAMTRTDLMVVAEDDRSVQTAEGMNALFKKDLRVTDFNDHGAEAFGQMVRVGIGWLEVSREDDPFKNDYRVGSVDWREMWYDWRAREFDLSDARYIVRRKWFDADILAEHWPKKRELIRFTGRGWPSSWFARLRDHTQSDLRQDLEHEQEHSLEELEWRDVTRNRVAQYEIFYRVPQRVTVLVLPDDMKIQFDRNNPKHIQAVESGHGELRTGATTRLRHAYYIGPHRMHDDWHEFSMPHYIPCIFKREGKSRAPYGMVRHMISPQQDINARRSKLYYNLSSTRVIVDEDAVDNHQETAAQIALKDAYIKRNPDRSNPSSPGIEIDEGQESNQTEFALLRQSAEDLHSVSGIYPEFAGQQSRSGQSNDLFENMVQEGTKVLGRPLSNWVRSRRAAGRLMLTMRMKDMASRPNVAVTIERSTLQRSRTIVLNGMSEGRNTRSNDILRMRAHVALSDFPSTVTYREQKFVALSEIVKSMPPEIAGMMMDLVVQASNMPNQGPLLDRLRQLTGFGPDPTDPQEAEALMRQRQQKEEMEQRQAELQFAEQEADIEKKRAEAAYSMARAKKTGGPDMDFTEAKTVAELTALAESEKDSLRKDVDLRTKLLEAGARLIGEANREDQPKPVPTKKAA